MTCIVAPGRPPISRAAQSTKPIPSADIMPNETVEPERIEQSADERAGHGKNFDDRQRQRISDQHIGAEFVKIIGHERGGGASSRRRSRRRAPPGHARAAREISAHRSLPGRGDGRGRAAETLLAAVRGEGGARLIAPRQARRPRQRKAGSSHRRSPRARSAITSPAAIARLRMLSDWRSSRTAASMIVRHDQRPFGADARAGHDVIEDCADDRGRRRPFLDRIAQGKRRAQRQAAAAARRRKCRRRASSARRKS